MSEFSVCVWQCAEDCEGRRRDSPNEDTSGPMCFSVKQDEGGPLDERTYLDESRESEQAEQL